MVFFVSPSISHPQYLAKIGKKMNIATKEILDDLDLYERVVDLIEKYIERHGECKFYTEILEPSVGADRLLDHDLPLEEFLFEKVWDEELVRIESKLLEQREERKCLVL
ncbi:MAG: hypothetical protein C4617_05080 [Candidatus Liberibacter europaeus]|uniref:Uncharacterized protein n=1 Tax=Candidatus Liberibacter europaeus TaxID=744859 RepID=A0A2T4VWH8_9HYPH|nr:MAG: hypothetical protein C4617_05080 [Candidatus Liberibacter europaeus]